VVGFSSRRTYLVNRACSAGSLVLVDQWSKYFHYSKRETMRHFGLYNPERQTLHKLRLPPLLAELIENGTLEAEVARVQAAYKNLNERLDALEAQNPEAAKLQPWFAARQAWKKAGRPEADWWEMLWVEQSRSPAINKAEISHNLLNQYKRASDPKTPYGSPRFRPTVPSPSKN
jgi:hypothetical protein